VTQTPFRSRQTLGAALERDRLTHRVSRTAAAVDALRRRAGEHRGELGGAPRYLRQAIADFESQLTSLNTRLRDLAQDRESAPSPQTGGLG
jgi:hypothetical protein